MKDERLAWIWILFVSLFLMMLFSCKSTETQIVERVKTDSIYINKVQRDSVYVQDSVFVKEKNDTIWIERWKTMYKEKVRMDTCSVVKVDSIPVPYEVVKKEEVKYTPLITKILAWIGGIVMLCFFTSIAIYLYNMFKPE